MQHPDVAVQRGAVDVAHDDSVRPREAVPGRNLGVGAEVDASVRRGAEADVAQGRADPVGPGHVHLSVRAHADAASERRRALRLDHLLVDVRGAAVGRAGEAELTRVRARTTRRVDEPRPADVDVAVGGAARVVDRDPGLVAERRSVRLRVQAGRRCARVDLRAEAHAVVGRACHADRGSSDRGVVGVVEGAGRLVDGNHRISVVVRSELALIGPRVSEVGRARKTGEPGVRAGVVEPRTDRVPAHSQRRLALRRVLGRIAARIVDLDVDAGLVHRPRDGCHSEAEGDRAGDRHGHPPDPRTSRRAALLTSVHLTTPTRLFVSARGESHADGATTIAR